MLNGLLLATPMSYFVRFSDVDPDSLLTFFSVHPNFRETTRTLLADVSAAQGQPIPVIPASSLSSANHSVSIDPSTPEPIKYPFNLILTSATIPKYLGAYIGKHHPSLVRLASTTYPRLFRWNTSVGREVISLPISSVGPRRSGLRTLHHSTGDLGVYSRCSCSVTKAPRSSNSARTSLSKGQEHGDDQPERPLWPCIE